MDTTAPHSLADPASLAGPLVLLVLGLLPVLAGCAGIAPAPAADSPDAAAVARVLDDFHAAAAAADGPRYFAHFAPEGVFLGTDATERWTVAEFRAYAEPFFSKGKGWTYRPRDRHVFLSEDGRTAWFDERVDNERYGELRGTGVLRVVEGRWLVAQYNLAFPVPNERVPAFLEMVRGR